MTNRPGTHLRPARLDESDHVDIVTAARFNPNPVTIAKMYHGEFPISIEDRRARIVSENDVALIVRAHRNFPPHLIDPFHRADDLAARSSFTLATVLILTVCRATAIGLIDIRPRHLGNAFTT
jgi:hypothetical protein